MLCVVYSTKLLPYRTDSAVRIILLLKNILLRPSPFRKSPKGGAPQMPSTRKAQQKEPLRIYRREVSSLRKTENREETFFRTRLCLFAKLNRRCSLLPFRPDTARSEYPPAGTFVRIRQAPILL